MWFVFAISAAILSAANRLSNQYLKLPGHYLTVTIKSFQILYFFPFLFFVDWPDNYLFYLMAFLTGPLVLLQDRTFFNFTAQYGAGPISRVEPLSIPFVFTAWLFLHPSQLFELAETPLVTLGIAGCLTFCVYCALSMKKCVLSFEILRAMIPLVVIMGTINILAKTGIDQAPSFDGIVVYGFIQSMTLVVLSPLMNKKVNENSATGLNVENRQRFFSAAFLLSLLMMGIIIFRLYGFIYTPNPAYVTAVMLTAPFGIMIFYRVIGHREGGNILAGIGIVVSAIALSLLVSLN